ncbi:MAG: SDR family oxidoreductase [Desulfurivibrionaceae bacterium]
MKILVTGATGYIGRRLKERLLGKPDCRLRLLVRNRNKVRPSVRDRVEIVEGDTFNEEPLNRALAGIEVAYYLIHSMGSAKDYRDLDRLSAENFREAAIRAGVKRIIYLGGLGVRETASKHLLSRIETGEVLSAKPEWIETIWFRAGVIIGSGSASFEIIRNLVQKLPVMVTPKWVNTLTQPIAVNDVISYLAAAADKEFPGNLTVDIGSSPMSFREMILEAAAVMNLKRLMIPVPVLSPKLSSYWLILLTPINYQLAAALVEGLKSETVVLNDHARRYFPEIVPVYYRQAIRQAMGELEDNQVLSRWCDSSGGAVCDIKDLDDPTSAVLRDSREYPLGDATPAEVFTAACTLGGEHGWFRYHFLWQFRGLVDKLLGGYGLNRGRRVRDELRVGDSLDFWKVADLRENKRLLLLAQMKVPGKAWLEFDIQPDKLVQTAHFLPSGLWGRLYWYSVAPLHHLVFSNLARQIVLQARRNR